MLLEQVAVGAKLAEGSEGVVYAAVVNGEDVVYKVRSSLGRTF